MNEYSHILVALDLTSDSKQIIDRAYAQAQLNKASLILMDLTEVQNQLDQHTHKQLKALAADIGLGEEHTHVLIGRPETEIHRFADENGVDLIVVGSHGRHGLQLLLGSTSSATLHRANCDVLAVRIKS